MGAEFRNITFPGERAAAEETLARYRDYQADDRTIRALVTAGHLDRAVAFCTSYAPGASNHDFEAYDQSLERLIAINQNAFDRTVRAGVTRLDGWAAALWAGSALTLVLSALGVRGRLGEYRRVMSGS